jgi:flavin-binding protein dodecin
LDRVAAAPASASTPQARLEASEQALDRAAASLRTLPTKEVATYGGHLEATLASLDLAAAEVAAALAGAKTRSAAGPPSAGPPPAIPRLPQVAPEARRTPLVEAVDAMNESLAALIDDSAATGSKMAALDLPGDTSSKILAGIGQAGAELSAGVEFHNNAPNPEPAAAPDEPETSLVPSVIASLALSIGFALAGMHFAKKARVRAANVQ